MFLLTDGQVTPRFLPNYAPAIARLQNSNIVRIGNSFLLTLSKHLRIIIIIIIISLLAVEVKGQRQLCL